METPTNSFFMPTSRAGPLYWIEPSGLPRSWLLVHFANDGLLIAAGSASDVAALPHAEISRILIWFVAIGLAVWAGLALTARRAGVAPPQTREKP